MDKKIQYKFPIGARVFLREDGEFGYQHNYWRGYPGVITEHTSDRMTRIPWYDISVYNEKGHRIYSNSYPESDLIPLRTLNKDMTYLLNKTYEMNE